MIGLAQLLEGPQSLKETWIAPDPARAREDRTIARALTILEGRALATGLIMTSPERSGEFFRLRLADETREHFEAAFLDNRHRLLKVERLFSGTIDQSVVHARIVVQRALALNAAAVLLAHNHPSGDPEPSPADRSLTAQLKQALALVEVRVLDHLIVTHGRTVSLAALGWV